MPAAVDTGTYFVGPFSKANGTEVSRQGAAPLAGAEGICCLVGSQGTSPCGHLDRGCGNGRYRGKAGTDMLGCGSFSDLLPPSGSAGCMGIWNMRRAGRRQFFCFLPSIDAQQAQSSDIVIVQLILLDARQQLDMNMRGMSLYTYMEREIMSSPP
jgi:hypothetical protein